MRELFLEFSKKGAMTKEDLAQILKISPESVRRLASTGKIPRIKHTRLLRFDPEKMIEVFCAPETGRSLKTERQKADRNPKKGFLECL